MKYRNYIELSANYESVVDLDADKRHPNLWKDYIVHDDMRRTVDAVCQTINWEDNDKRRSFWIHGTYGTGKTYAAIVLKHLFEDEVGEIEDFLNKPSLTQFKRRFLKIRAKGEFLVTWKSGVTDIKSGTHLMMEMEVAIKDRLKQQFGDKAYYGRSSLINAAKDAVFNDIINWDYVFDSPQYGLSDEYEDLEEFREAVKRDDYSAISVVKNVCDDHNLAMFANTVDKFEEWIKDIIAGNDLQDTGIFFIWDEFTGFLRDCGDDNVLQRLSELCKQADAPFFLCLIVHRDPTWVDQLGGETYEQILHRYHELEYHITESAAYDLIGDSIIARTGMQSQWQDVKRDVLKTITKYGHEFDNLDQSVNISARMSQLCPLHPMTVSMLSTVAQNFGASQRTLFRFMKDRQESSEGVGFIHFIENNSPDHWAWLTPDYLWDYFFMRTSDMRSFDSDARQVIHHFHIKKDFLSDEVAMHVFKAALLLIAVMGSSSISNLYSRQNSLGNRIGPTKRTLHRCFRGQLDEKTIDRYLASFEDIGLLRLDKQTSGDDRLELPYGGGGDLFEARVEQIRRKYTRYVLFSKGGVFSRTLEDNLWDSTRATFGRIYTAACSSEKQSIKQRLNEINGELNKAPWKLGLLAIAVAEPREYAALQTTVKKLAADDETGRLVVALLKEPIPKESINGWHDAIANKELSAEDGKAGSASSYESQAAAIVAERVGIVSDGQIFACYCDTQFSSLYGKSDLMRIIENEVLFRVFPAAPERIVTSNTAFKRCTDRAISAGLTKDVNTAQLRNISMSLKGVNAWDVDGLDQLRNLKGPNACVIAELATLVDREFSDTSRVSLDALWSTLKQAPFGYYDNLAVGCFLGLVLRSHVNGSFNWIDENNNTHPPTPENLVSMLSKMISGKAVNEYFTSGSEQWQKFKPYARAIFSLSDSESVSEMESRKYMRAKIQEVGIPFWTLKYLPEDKFGGNDAKRVAARLVDLLCDFVYEASPDQEAVMGEVLTLFNGRGWLRTTIQELYGDKAVMLDAFKRFIYTKASNIESLVKELGLTDMDLFDSLHGYLQGSISSWLEEQVGEKLVDLADELTIIRILNQALGVKKKSYVAHQVELRNIFGHMKVPGTVIETLPDSWVSALQIMRRISKEPWGDICEKAHSRDELDKYARSAWEHVTQPELILGRLLQAREVIVSQAELDQIYASLQPLPYETTTAVFESSLRRLLQNVSYNRNVDKLNRLWVEKSETTTVSQWCQKANVPIAWVIDEPLLTAVETLKKIQDKIKVSSDVLEDAVGLLATEDLMLLKDEKHLSDCFFAHIGDDYRSVFRDNGDLLIGRLKTNNRVSGDVYSWANKEPQIRKVLKEYLKKTYQEKAKERVRSMPEAELRQVVTSLLDMSPELYSHFLN